MNRKGFMMAEVVVVSSIVLIALTGLYTSYGKIYSIYNTRINYYDVDTLYRLGYYRDVMIENENSNSQKLINEYLTNASMIQQITLDKNILIPPDNNIEERIYLIKNPKDNLNEESLKAVFSNINQTFIDYFNFLEHSLNNKTLADNIMIMESCENKNKCKYAYLEVYNEK